MDSDRILVIPPPDYPGNIFVFNCRTFPTGAIKLKDALENCELILELPGLNDGCQCDGNGISCRPIRSVAPRRKDDALFSWANKLPVIRVWLFIVEDEDKDWPVDILIPASTIISRIERCRHARETWERTATWGEIMSETRIVDTLRAGDTRGVCGSRYITVSSVVGYAHISEEGSEEGEENHQFIIYDFDSPPAMLKDILSGEIDAEVGKRFLHEEPKPLPGSNAMFLFDDVETSAPCRVIRTGIPARFDEQAELFEDGIIVRSRHDSQEYVIHRTQLRIVRSLIVSPQNANLHDLECTQYLIRVSPH